jgi:hypothetical protein
MNVLESEMKKLIQKSKDYFATRKRKIEFKILGVSLSIFAIYEAGESLGELIYFIKN